MSAAFNTLRALSDFQSSYFDPMVDSCNWFGDLENTTHWQRFSRTATFDLWSQLPKMTTDEERAEKKALKEYNKLMHLVQNSYVPLNLPDRPNIDAYRVWQIVGERGASCRAMEVMLREGYKSLSFHTVKRSFMDRFYHVGDFFDNIFQLNYDVREGIFVELRRIKIEMFFRREDLEVLFVHVLKTVGNYFKVIEKYMDCGLQSHFFDSYFSYDGVFERKQLKFKEYLLITFESLMKWLLADMDCLDQMWAFIVVKAFYDDFMPIDRLQMETTIQKRFLMDVREVQLLFQLHGINDVTVQALNDFVQEKFGWSVAYQQPFIDFYP